MNEIPQLALSALATLVSGYLLYLIKSDRSRIDRETSALGLKIGCESDERSKAIAIEAHERQQAINEEANTRRDKDEALGREISRLRERMAYERGKAGKTFEGRETD